MRSLLLLALMTVVSTELCHTSGKQGKADRNSINEVKAIVRTGAQFLVGESCPWLANNIEKVLFEKNCRSLAKQAICYGKRVEERYADKTEAVSYEQLASGVDELAELGNLACDMGGACYKQIARLVKNKCMCKNKKKCNPNFVQDTIAAAEIAYRANAQASVEQFVNARSETLFGEVANLVMGRFGSVSDFEDFLNDFLSEDVQEKIKSDAEVAAEEVVKLAKGFCRSGCFNQSASFIESLFDYMHDGDECIDATQFCGSCKQNAHYYFEDSGTTIPCCLDKVIQKGIEAYDYIGQQYGEKIEELSDMVSDELSETARNRAEEIRDELNRQAGCIDEAYEEHKPKCGGAGKKNKSKA